MCVCVREKEKERKKECRGLAAVLQSLRHTACGIIKSLPSAPHPHLFVPRLLGDDVPKVVDQAQRLVCRLRSGEAEGDSAGGGVAGEMETAGILHLA